MGGDHASGARGALGSAARRDEAVGAVGVVPVAEGGGCCSLDNFRTLCTPCHQKETNALRQRLVARKNAALVPEQCATLYEAVKLCNRSQVSPPLPNPTRTHTCRPLSVVAVLPAGSELRC